MDLKELGNIELKALGFEQMKLLQQTQNNLMLIEQELQRREKEDGGKDDSN